jgi:hypothetical protein
MPPQQRQVFYKDPAEYLDYKFDWSAWLSSGDTIADKTVTVSDGIDVDTVTNTTTSVTFWLSGGTAARTYDITVNIVTAGGRIGERSAFLKVLDL